MAIPDGTRLGPYEIQAPLGVGGMGEVYRATDTRLKRQVAIKVLPEALSSDPERLARFQREAEVLAALNHPNIAAIYGLEKSGGMTALVMELVEGPTLADRIAQGAIPVDEALPIAKQIAEALEAAHEQGIIHRDLKPANIKVRPDGTVKVLDFGLAKAMEPVGVTSSSVTQSPTITTPAMTQAGMVLGTAAYMSPEQTRGKPVDKRTDIWAFGCVLYEMLSSRRAFEADDVSLTLARVLERDAALEVLPDAVPSRIRGVIELCLRKDPKQRLGDMRDVRLAMDGAFERSSSHPLRPLMSRPRLAGAGLALVLTGAAVGLLAGRSSSRPEVPMVPPARFTVEATASVRLPLARHVPALSPDGRYLAFIGQTARGDSIWLRPLDSLETRELPGTLGATSIPFWSPDSLDVAFVSGQRLWKIRTSDGVRESIAQLPQESLTGINRSGTWNTAGDIVLAYGERLLHVRAGSVTALTPLDGARSYGWPLFLPEAGATCFS